MTNGDRIRQMTDEELAVKLGNVCELCPIGDGCEYIARSCEDIFLEWLKQEAQDDER